MIFLAKKEYTLSFINNICYVAPGTGKPLHIDRPFHGLVYYAEDDGLVFNFEKYGEYKVLAGSIVYLPKGSSYRVNSPEKHSGCYAVNFDLAEELSEQPFVLQIENSSKAESLFVLAEKCWRSKSLEKRLKCRSVFYDILSLVASENAREYYPCDKREKLLPAVEHIHKFYLEKEITVDELAEMCEMSGTYFRKLFSNVYHTSPVKYINSLKISHAKELIMSDMYSTADIAHLSGFSDDCYFRRVFKNETSFSPREYRMSKK